MDTMPIPLEKDGLRISIAVPLDGNRRTIKLRPDAPCFHVVIFNASNKPQKIWAEDCSSGNGNLILEIAAIEEETLPQLLVVERRAFMWRQNSIRGVTLEPGDAVVRGVQLYQYQPEERSEGLAFHAHDQVHYTGFPSLGVVNGRHVIRMRAVFTSSASETYKAHSIWSGCIASEMRDYVIWGRYL